jgi:hypothetical protein
MKLKQKKYIFGTLAFLGAIALFLVQYSFVSAYQIETLPGQDVFGDFVAGPGKVELEINPGESKTQNITITNRMGDDRMFSLSVEDFTGSTDSEATVVLLGDERGPYSLKDYISFPESTFELKHGQRAVIPVTIFVPTDAQPGGLYGSVLSSTFSKPNKDGSGPRNSIVARIGTLFFVTVPGEVKHEGSLKEFSTKDSQRIFGSGPISFKLLYENKGSVYVNPYGEIRIKNLFGKEVGNVEVLPWFAMPASLRSREVEWKSSFLVGKYTAVASINRGYDNIVDTMEFSFWVIPVKLLAIFVVGLALFILAIRFVVTRFEIKKK